MNDVIDASGLSYQDILAALYLVAVFYFVAIGIILITMKIFDRK
jgi:hypothetical protein